MSTIQVIWEPIEAWYAEQNAAHLPNPGASGKAGARTGKRLGMLFPPEFPESLQRHDGSTEGGWVGGDLLSFKDVQHERGIIMELLKGGAFDDNEDHNESSISIQADWWNAGWLPLHADGGGDGYVVDTVPAAAGQFGQVLFMNHEVGPGEASFDRMKNYLQYVLSELSSDNRGYSQEYDGLISRDEQEEE